jgi:hypothetical protein
MKNIYKILFGIFMLSYYVFIGFAFFIAIAIFPVYVAILICGGICEWLDGVHYKLKSRSRS